MNGICFALVAALAAVSASAQDFERRAEIRRGGPPGEGRCTVEVVIDGVAEVEVRWDKGAMRNLGGGPPQWRRLECTAPLPPNAGNFRFRALEGRGRQQLVRDPRNGGAAVVRIEDSQGGAGAYKFELAWSGPDFGGPPPPQERDRGADRDRDEYHSDRDSFYRREDWRQRFFQHVREDVEHVRTTTFPFGSDQFRLARTLQQLDELQDKLARHFYDERELNDVIDALGRVLRDNRLSGRDRDVLTDDLNRMRQFREHHGDWGAR
jgi:hypothetical protein